MGSENDADEGAGDVGRGTANSENSMLADNGTGDPSGHVDNDDTASFGVAEDAYPAGSDLASFRGEVTCRRTPVSISHHTI